MHPAFCHPRATSSRRSGADGVRAIPPARSTTGNLHAMSGAMRQIEDELTEGHEVLTREPAPVLIGSGWLLCAGSGAS
jgi:hypothetical protein